MEEGRSRVLLSRHETLGNPHQAFKALEAEIYSGRGRLRAYGISSNTFSVPADHPHFLRYDHLLELAAKVSRALEKGWVILLTTRCWTRA